MAPNSPVDAVVGSFTVVAPDETHKEIRNTTNFPFFGTEGFNGLLRV